MRDGPRPARLIEGLAIAFGAAALLVMVCSTLLAVVARSFSLSGLEWSYEIAGLSFIWVTFLGAVLAEVRRENAAFDVLKMAAPRWLRQALDRSASAVLGVVGLVLVVSSVAMLQRSAFVPTPLLRWPGWVIAAAAPVLGLGLCGLALLRLARPPAPSDLSP